MQKILVLCILIAIDILFAIMIIGMMCGYTSFVEMFAD